MTSRRVSCQIAASALSCALALSSAAWALPTTANTETSPNSASADIPFSAPASKMVEIDGRFIKVEVNLVRFVPGAPGPDIRTTTQVNVQLSVNDGAQLPVGLDAAGVRFEYVTGTRRAFFKPLEPIPVAASEDAIFELDFQPYQGDLSDRNAVKNLRTTVRLEYNGRVIRVPFGVLRVETVPLP